MTIGKNIETISMSSISIEYSPVNMNFKKESKSIIYKMGHFH